MTNNNNNAFAVWRFTMFCEGGGGWTGPTPPIISGPNTRKYCGKVTVFIVSLYWSEGGRENLNDLNNYIVHGGRLSLILKIMKVFTGSIWYIVSFGQLTVSGSAVISESPEGKRALSLPSCPV